MHLAARIAAGLPDLTADPDRIGQVLAGLLANALRHTPPGGCITVAAEPAGRDVRITVTDTGDGIAPEHLAHIFERFYRADAARDAEHGTGMFPLVLVDGQFFSAGRLPRRKLGPSGPCASTRASPTPKPSRP